MYCDDRLEARYLVVSVEDLLVSLLGYFIENEQGSNLLRRQDATCTNTTAAQQVALQETPNQNVCKDGTVTKTAYLRVYSPEADGSRDPVPGFVRSYGMLSEAEGDNHWSVEWKGRRLVCPRNLRLRVLESTVAFANAFRGFGVGLIPEDAAEAADRELRVYHTRNPSHRSHVLTSAWHVPVRWFIAFKPSEKLLYEAQEGPRLRYRTDINEARGRVAHAQQVLEKIGLLHGPAEELGQLAGWLEPFPEDSMVELDYADVSDLFDPQELVFDESCDLVHESIEALATGDLQRAGENYGKVVTRWAPAFSVTFSN